MSTRLLLISDTHIPGRARAIPAALRAAADVAAVVDDGTLRDVAVIRI